MRFLLAIAAAVLSVGSAFADEPAACYIKRDPTGDFIPGKIQRFGADRPTSAQIAHLVNNDNKANSRCFKRHIEREGGYTLEGMGILYAIRIAPSGKVTQVSVVAEDNINDGMLMACFARSICEWKFAPRSDGAEQLVLVPPVITGRLRGNSFRRDIEKFY
ncbi:hypothetical protein [Pseudoduganella buxea]|uniref:TonB C-terminal domain-containing protein n=1 Tax=Pseudoduganella buxea TaxID=1949069 RepID=A0A6I3SZR8_9BURK|nr:hypothetical protein [Pseudoduganella buxea]MTV54831.1 hypothetical protein [Pseudoduganella buxea]GGC01516.1 hypothetical protein GCM10011572_24300 [Pseudoduganella buxea]